MSLIDLDIIGDDLDVTDNPVQKKTIDQKSANIKKKQTKKENKLLLTFVQRFLPEKQPEIFSQLKTNNLNQNSRNLLLDNRDYQLSIGTERLVAIINQIGSKSRDIVEDVFVLSSKTFVLVRFISKDHCLRVKNILQSDCGSTIIHTLNVIALVPDFIYDSCVEIHLESVTDLIRLFTEQPDGLALHNNFITEEEEKSLIRFAEQCFSDHSVNKVSHLRNRESVHFGFGFSYKLNTIVSNSTTVNQDSTVVIDENLPEQCRFVIDRLVKEGILNEIPDQMTINHYHGQNGDHIPLHVDTHSMCTNWLASLSLGSDIVMTFENPRANEDKIRKCFLQNRSMMIMRDEARYLWRHGIAQTSVDIVPFDGQQQSTLQSSFPRISLSPRGERYSFIFRKTTTPGYSCRCSYPESCDSQQPKQTSKSPNMPTPSNDLLSSHGLSDPAMAQQLESEYVHQTYDEIASHFSSTRYACWPRVSEFLDSLAPGSLLLDVGCGNGKYLSINSDKIVSIGTDRSEKLLEICRQREFEVFQDNCLTVARTMRAELFDAVICIAVIHHLATEERRLKAIQSLVDLLQDDGRALIYVWAFEQKLSGSASKYLRQKDKPINNSELQTETSNQPSDQTIKLKVHQNRTEFKQQDLFVPWTKTKSAAPLQKKSEQESTKLRFYHVFREGELELLLHKFDDDISIEQIYYDQGNWCSIVRKRRK